LKPFDTSLARSVVRDPVHWLAFGLGTGLSPVAPGTVGSVLGVLLAWLTESLGIEVQFVLAATLMLTGIPICGTSARRIGVHDHPGIVWDEIAAMYGVLLVAPDTAIGWTVAFLLFRLFDIWKPWPIRDLDHRMAGGLGIMLDDIIAALYAALLLGLWGWLTR